MLRSRNPFSAQMAGSRVYFRFRSPDHLPPDLEALLEAKLPGKVSILSEACADASPVTIATFAHEHIDAFGALYVLNSLGVRAMGAGVIGSHGQDSGRFGGMPFHHAWQVMPHVVNAHDRSPTQRLIEVMLSRVPALQGASLAMPIALDDLSRLDDRCFRGNSWIMVQLPAHSFLELARLPRREWKARLQLYARRLLQQESLGRELPAFDAMLTLSSWQAVDRYAWCPPVTPESLTCLAIPSRPEFATLVTWSTDSVQGLGLCAGEGHALLEAWEGLRQVWEALLLEPGCTPP